MNYLKKIGYSFLYFFGILLTLTLLLTVFNYFNWFNSGFISILEISIPIISILIGGYQFGKRSNENGLLEGLKLGLLIIAILIILNLILKNSLSFKNSIYYVILLLSCIGGSIIGINRKKESKN